MCTFAHRYYSFVVETKVTKRADFQTRKPALIFIGHKKFYRTPINRQMQSQLLRIDPDDDFGILLATAQYDTIGAVTVKPIEP